MGIIMVSVCLQFSNTKFVSHTTCTTMYKGGGDFLVLHTHTYYTMYFNRLLCPLVAHANAQHNLSLRETTNVEKFSTKQVDADGWTILLPGLLPMLYNIYKTATDSKSEVTCRKEAFF